MKIATWVRIGTLGLFLGFSSFSHAVTARFDFNAGWLIAPPYAGHVYDQSMGKQAIVLQNASNPTAATSAATFTTSTSFGQYERWANGLTAGEGLASFNINLRPDLSNVDNWGQFLRLTKWDDPSLFRATAGDGWNVAIVPAGDISSYGYTLSWWTTDNNKRIRANTDLAGFSFTVPVEMFYPMTGEIAQVMHGNSYNVWFGTQNAGFNPVDPKGFIQPLLFDSWWNPDTGAEFASESNSVWNGTLQLTATVIPEPSTGSLLLVGAAFAWLRRRRSA